MGMLLDDPAGIAGMDMRTYYSNQLENDKILLNQIDKAIAALSATDGVQEYTIDTGQDRQTVKRADIATLVSTKKQLLLEISALSRALFGGSGWRQIIPGY